MTAKIMEQSALKRIKQLRKQKLEKGIPFMINTDILDSGQCFLEFPDGIIKIVEAESRTKDFVTVYEFSLKESDELRKRLKII